MSENLSRIKFYGIDDMSTGQNLVDSESKLTQLDLSQPIADINDALELYNIVEMFKTDARLNRWSEDAYLSLRNKALSLVPMIGRFVSTISDENINIIFKSVEIDFIEDFWELYSYYHLQKRISSKTFDVLLTNDFYYLRPLFSKKNIVDAYPAELTIFLMSSAKNAEMLIDAYLSFHQFGSSPTLYLPDNFSSEMREKLILDYLSWPSVNLNYVKLIFESRDDKNLRLSAKTKHAAQMEYNSMSQKLFSSRSGSGVLLSYEIWFEQNQEEPIREFINSEGKPVVSYSQEWFENNLDFPTLWNNFMFIFNFVDTQCRCQFVSNPMNQSIISKSVGTRGKTAYFLDITEQFENKVFREKLNAYLKFLSSRQIHLDDMISWFFSNYLVAEFNAQGFVFNPPSRSTTTLEKCKLIATEIDSILKQFEIYALEGEINRSLFEFNSDPIKFKNIKSMIPDKYFYAQSNNCKTCMYYLFSNQSSVSYTKKLRKEHNNLYELLGRFDLTRSDFHSFNIPHIDFLINQNCLYENENSIIQINEDRALVLKDLFDNQVCCKSYFIDLEDEITYLQSAGDIRFASTLFSEQEQEYISYVLTQSDFSNGLDLRNKYVHGNYPVDSDQHNIDYLEFLKILILIIMKVNEEFCLRANLVNSASNQT